MATLRLKDLASGTSDTFKFDPRKLVRDDAWNARIQSPELRAHIDWLKGSIRERGVEQPLTIYLADGAAKITDGFCRHTAVMELIGEGVEIDTIPCKSEPRGADEADRVLGMFTRNSGKNLTPLEQAAVFSRLIGFGWDVAKVATRAGISKTHVENMLNLAAAPVPVKALVAEGTVSATLATAVLRAEGESEGAATLVAAAADAKAAGKAKVKRATVIKPTPAPAAPEPATPPQTPPAAASSAWPPAAPPKPANTNGNHKKIADALDEVHETLSVAANRGEGLRTAQVTHLLQVCRKALGQTTPKAA